MTPPTPQPTGLPPKKKLGPLAWVLIGCGGLIILAGVLVLAGGFFIAYKAKQAGLDPELMRKNPALAVTKLIAAMNPDIEVLKVDDARGIITVRDKKQNKVLTINLEDAKKGRIVFQEAGKEAVSIEAHGDGSSGTLDIKSAEGSMHIGAGGTAPAWVPSYPGSSPEGTFATKGAEGEAGSFHFSTKDPVDKVVNWYADALKKAGFQATSNVMQQDGKASGGVVSGENAATRQTVTVILGSGDQGASVNVTYGTKK